MGCITSIEDDTKKFNDFNFYNVPDFSLYNKILLAKVVDIYDGDTCTIALIYTSPEKNVSVLKFKCRLRGIDCPEMKPLKSKVNREEEIRRAILARNKVIELGTSLGVIPCDSPTKAQLKEKMMTNRRIVRLDCYEFDKYGRLLVDIWTPDGVCINHYLVEHKYAVEYDGGTKTVIDYSKNE